MPLKIGNYGNWERDRPGNRPGSGYHPPACTCYTCNEGHARRAARSGTGRTQPRPGSSPHTPPSARPRPTASAGVPQHPRSRNKYTATSRPRKRSRRWLWWSLALAVVIYAVYVGMGALDSHHATPSSQPSDLPNLFARQATEPLQYVATWLTTTSPTDADTVADSRSAEIAQLAEAAAWRGANAQSAVRPTLRPTVAPVPTPAVKALTNVARVTWVTPRPPTIKPLPLEQLALIQDLTASRISRVREASGLPPLETSDELVQIAAKHSEDMATRGYFSHNTPNGDTFSDRYRQDRFRCGIKVGSVIHQGAENIYQGWQFSGSTLRNGRVISRDWLTDQEIASQAVSGWMSSPGHRANILNPVWERQGIGVASDPKGKLFFTQNFC